MCIKLSDFDGYTDLAEAIVRQAVEDYRNISNGYMSENVNHNKIEIEKFFLSEWGNALCYGHGEDVLRIIKQG